MAKAGTSRLRKSGKKTNDEGDWPLSSLVRGVYQAGLWACPFWHFIDNRERDKKREAKQAKQRWDPGPWNRRRAVWVVGWLALLVLLWALPVTPDRPFAYVCAGLALWRLLEIFVTGLGTVLDATNQPHARDLETIAIYAFQLALIFAICERALPSGDFSNTPSTQLDYIYVSWTNLTTLGNSYYPHSELAKITTGLTAGFGLFLVGVLLAFGINKIRKS
jgi:hypothetical protein